MSSKRTASKHEHGQSLVELALTMTLMLIILAGTVDIGRAFFTYISMRDAAQEGALYAEFAFVPDPITPKTISQVCTDIQNRIIQSNKDSSNTPSMVDLGNDVNITIQFKKTAGAWTNCSALATRPTSGDSILVKIDHKGFPLATPFLGALIGTQTIQMSTSIQDSVLAPYTSS